jgi:hypothetical protein
MDPITHLIKPAPTPTPAPDPLVSEMKELLERISSRAVSDATNWLTDFDTFWRTRNGIGPAEKLAVLGTLARKLFTISHGRHLTLIQALAGERDDLVQEIQAKLATIPAHTIHDDGRVTLDEPFVEVIEADEQGEAVPDDGFEYLEGGE